jgi:hypothetical protein
MASAPEGDEPVSYGYEPIWETLISLYQVKCNHGNKTSEDCKNMQRGYNLQAAYEGWLAVGCPKVVTTNGLVYQQMTIADSSSDFATYQCELARTGCYHKSDCHYHTGCYCHGESCIDGGDEVTGTGIRRNKVRGVKSGKWDTGVNKACYYSWGAVHCECHYNWSGGLRARQLWVQNGHFKASKRSSEELVV